MPILLGQSPGLRHVKAPYDLKINPNSLGWHRRPIVTAPNCRAGTRVRLMRTLSAKWKETLTLRC